MNTSEESIFAAALAVESPEAREAYLKQACAGRPELLENVRSLLEAWPRGNFLEQPLVPDPFSCSVLLNQPAEAVIGPYHIRELIGHGGMGAVYLAEQLKPVRRRVAVKIMRPGLATRDAVRRFQLEQQTLAMMDHPNIARVLDASVTETGISYFVMELVNGTPLLAYCEQESLSVKARIELFIECCLAVQHAHQKGIIHRDIKPSNVLVNTTDGIPAVKVIDFGIAKAFSSTPPEQVISGNTTATQFGVFLGTPQYMSPEQAAMGRVRLDHRADVYSLGALLYAVLTGVPPYDTERFQSAAFDEVREIITKEDPLWPSVRVRQKAPAVNAADTDEPGSRRLAQQLSGDLDYVIMKAMEKERDRRYDSVSDLVADLQRFLNSQPVIARAPTSAYRFSRFFRRHRSRLTNGIVAAACLMIGLTVAMYQTMRAWDAEKAAIREKQLAVDAENDRRQSIYASDLRLAHIATEKHDSAAANAILQRYIPRQHEPDQRSFDWKFLAAQNEVETRELFRTESSLYFVCRLSQADRLACCGADGLIRIVDETTGQLHLTIPAEQGEVNGMALSPDGSVLASAGDDGTIALWDAHTGVLKSRFQAHRKQAFQTAWSPDGKALITCGNEPDARIWAADDFHEIGTINSGSDLECIAVSVNGDVAVGAEGGTVILSRFPEQNEPISELQTLTDNTSEHCGAVTFSPDGKFLAAGRQNGRVVIYQMSPRPVRSVQSYQMTDSVGSLIYTADGQRLAVGLRDGSVSFLELTETSLLSDRENSRPSEVSSDDSVNPSEIRRKSWPLHQGTAASLLPGRKKSQVVSAGEDGRLLSSVCQSYLPVQKLPGRYAEIAFDGSSRLLANNNETGDVYLLRANQQSGSNRSVSDGSLKAAASSGDSPEDHSGSAASSAIASSIGTSSAGQTESKGDSFPLPATHLRVATQKNVVCIGRISDNHVREIRCCSPDGSGPEQVWKLAEHESAANYEISPDGRYAAIEVEQLSGKAGSGVMAMTVVDLHTQEELSRIPITMVHRIRFSPDSRQIACSVQRGILLFDTRTLQSTGELNVPEVRQFGFSPNGREIATVGDDRLLRIWQLSDRRNTHTVQAHGVSARDVAWTADGLTLATVGSDGLFRCWRRQGLHLTLEVPFSSPLYQLEFSPDGNRAAILAHDGSAFLVNCSPATQE
jgi:serine/threonine protein kinase/WD40 repeat protein